MRKEEDSAERKSVQDNFIWGPEKIEALKEFIEDCPGERSYARRFNPKGPLSIAFEDIGDITGFMVFDAGAEGRASRFLAERVGDGRIIGVNIWREFYKEVRKHVQDDLLKKVVLINDDMRFVDYLKDRFFDLVVSYGTMASIERMTPRGTLPILRQFYRILKIHGRLLAVEPLPPQEVKPIDEAQELQLRLDEVYDQFRPEKIERYYKPSELVRMLQEIGFEEVYWKIVTQGSYHSPEKAQRNIKGWNDYILKQVVQNEEEKEEYMRQIQGIAEQVKEIGSRGRPYYALYATRA